MCPIMIHGQTFIQAYFFTDIHEVEVQPLAVSDMSPETLLKTEDKPKVITEVSSQKQTREIVQLMDNEEKQIAKIEKQVEDIQEDTKLVKVTKKQTRKQKKDKTVKTIVTEEEELEEDILQPDVVEAASDTLDSEVITEIPQLNEESCKQTVVETNLHRPSICETLTFMGPSEDSHLRKHSIVAVEEETSLDIEQRRTDKSIEEIDVSGKWDSKLGILERSLFTCSYTLITLLTAWIIFEI